MHLLHCLVICKNATFTPISEELKDGRRQENGGVLVISIGQDPNSSKSNQLHADFYRIFDIN